MNEQWENEPDTVDWKHAGMRCAVRRMKWSGGLNGYVAVPADHPWHGKAYDHRVHYPGLAKRQVNPDTVGIITLFCASKSCDIEAEEAEIALLLDAHGGITFAGPLKGEPDDQWWFGFDTAHDGDLSPNSDYTRGGVYRDIEYVKQNTEALADQLAKLMGPAK